MGATRGLTVTTPTDDTIVLTRSFAAPCALVFDALTKPELLVRWFGARGWNLTVCEIDLRVGGAWRFVSRGPGDEEMSHSGVYNEVVPPRRLVYTERFDAQSYPGESRITHDLTELAGSTTLTSTVLYPSREARDIVMRYPMARGVSQSYARLDGVLVLLRRSSTQPTTKEIPQ